MQIEKKTRQLNYEILPTLYKAYVEDENFASLIAAEWLQVSSIQNQAEQQIR